MGRRGGGGDDVVSVISVEGSVEGVSEVFDVSAVVLEMD